MAEKKATREAYGEALAEFGDKYDIIVLDADLSKSTKTDTFKKKFPERFINCGIAEANMASIAAGMATTGKTVFMSSFAMFATGRAFEQIRNSIGYPKLNVKIGGTHAGISVGEDGATHQCNEDIALMRVIPGMVVMNPADCVEARLCVEAAIKHEGPVYMRFGRLAVPYVFDENYKFEIGKGNVLKDGKDVTIVATGLLVAAALEAAEQLKSEGIDAAVLNIATIKPIDDKLLAQYASKTGAMVTAEEHSIIGGLGSAVCESLAITCPVPVIRLGMEDCYGKSGKAEILLDEYKLNAVGIIEKTKQVLKLKK